MFFKKCQVALEYIIVLSLVLAIVLAAYFVVYDRIYEKDDILEFKQAQNSIRQIVGEAEQVYYRGPPSKSAIRLQFPESTESISAEYAGSGYYVLKLTINPVSGPKVVSYPTKVPMKINVSGVSKGTRFSYVSIQAKRTSSEDFFVEVCSSDRCLD